MIKNAEISIVFNNQSNHLIVKLLASPTALRVPRYLHFQGSFLSKF